jgi:hydrogenase maturation protein HypF
MACDRIQTQWICVYGIVQGVGFRPFVSRIASQTGVRGSVANKGSYVEIFAQGIDEQLKYFCRELKEHPPERSAILKMDVTTIDSTQYEDFQIIESEKEAGDIFVSPDIATCPKCKQELFDSSNRRYMHPFINCTACGPRLTILDSMPYDRVRTSMGEFPMCPTCEWEYTHAQTRRYDAQPVCCNDCGPEVYLINRSERGKEAITYVRQAIVDGKVIAIKGIGGFHLCCDATNQSAVERLRQMKNRPVKPFAVMMRDMDTVERECELLPECKETLDGHQKPIILLKKQKIGTHLAPAVAPGNPKVGVMLPYAPVQMLLFDYQDDVVMNTDCLVMTSGNVSGAPICRTDEDAVKELSSFCDIMLSHNRKIRLRADDSVMDYYQGEPYMIRRSRGYAPLPFMLSGKWKGQVLAVGGELKNTFCLGKNQLFYPSPYVGDMADLRTVKALEESIVRMETLLEAEPTVVACDLHPKYNTTVVANEQNLPMIPVQHHYAHIVSCMAENDYADAVIGVAFDGTGYGLDGTIWGGEFLKADYDGFTRLGSIAPFLQVGGDASAKEGWRIAVSMLHDIYQDKAQEVIVQLGLCDEQNCKVQFMMAKRKINSVLSTSAGRLFDAVSAILGIRLSATFEGEASTSLEFVAESYEEMQTKEQLQQEREFWRGCLEWKTISDEDRFLLPTQQLVQVLTDARLEGKSSEQLAYAFHQLLADQIVLGCKEASRQTQIQTFALSGGVFQNQLLLKLVDEQLQSEGYQVLKHHLLPPNDGGIALGQAVVAMRKLQIHQ